MGIKSSSLDGGIGLIEVKGSLMGGDETDGLRHAIASFVDRNYQKLVIDLSGTEYINSTGIGVLVAAHTTYAKKNWQIRLCGMNKSLNNIFVITKLTLVFEVRDAREEAIKSFA